MKEEKAMLFGRQRKLQTLVPNSMEYLFKRRGEIRIMSRAEASEDKLSDNDKKVIDKFVNAYIAADTNHCATCERSDDYCCIKCFRDRYFREDN